MPAFDRAWIDAVCAACDPVFAAADVGFVRQFSLSEPGHVSAILWEAEPLRFAARYPDSRVEESYGDQWPAPCIDYWLYFERDPARVDLSFEGPEPPVTWIPVTGDGGHDGRTIADVVARTLLLDLPT